MATKKTSDPVENPTWYGEIRWMFTPEDIKHMLSHGINLGDYSNVKSHAISIFGQISVGKMPPGNPWPTDWQKTFENWITNDYPKGNASVQSKLTGMKTLTAGSAATRIRKEISTLSQSELADLKKAFTAIMQKDTTDPNGFYLHASWHGLPSQFCQHHQPGYNPWHRAFLFGFENALRSVPGCENVTLPYWDLTTPLPDVLTQAPFANYTLPIDLNETYQKGYVTTRYSAETITQNLEEMGVLEDLNRASTKTDWEDYNGNMNVSPNNTTILGHDGGHVSIGETMRDQAVSAFDPIFWFYHCNLDRLFWDWQVAMKATTLDGLLTTIQTEASRRIFTVPVWEALAPFTDGPTGLTSVKIVDSVRSLDVNYEISKESTHMKMLAATKGSTLASDKFFVHTDRVNARVKGINRLKIPGSFKVHLLKDEKIIATRAIFQPNEADQCQNCVENALIYIDFELPLEKVSNGKLGVWVEPLDDRLFGDHFPHKIMGNPTVNIRLLLSNE
jgi:tyrosinase